MKLIRKMLATSMITAAGATGIALALSATAAADPVAPAPVPAVPGLPFLQQLASNPAAATQLVQGLASVFTGAQTAAPFLPATPQPAAVPAAAAAPAATAAPASVPFLGDLAALMPAAQQATLTKAGPATAAPGAPVATAPSALPPMLMPLSALP